MLFFCSQNMSHCLRSLQRTLAIRATSDFHISHCCLWCYTESPGIGKQCHRIVVCTLWFISSMTFIHFFFICKPQKFRLDFIVYRLFYQQLTVLVQSFMLFLSLSLRASSDTDKKIFDFSKTYFLTLHVTVEQE